jgi:hypothetical protein
MCGERYLVGQVVAAVLDGGDDVGGGGAIARANGEGQICSASIKLELSLIELELEKGRASNLCKFERILPLGGE